MTQRQAPNTFRIYGIFGDATDLSACGPAQAGRRVWINGIELSPEESWSIRIHSPERVRLGLRRKRAKPTCLGHPVGVHRRQRVKDLESENPIR